MDGAGPPHSSQCPGCGAVLPRVDGPGPEYLLASPACWAAYGELLAAQYQDPARRGFHQLAVDAYGVQHPGPVHEHRAVQSLALHLMTLCLFLEHGVDPALGSDLHRRMADHPVFAPLDPPVGRGGLTVLDVPAHAAPGDVRVAVRAWAAGAWDAWHTHHPTVRSWLAASGLLPG